MVTLGLAAGRVLLYTSLHLQSKSREETDTVSEALTLTPT